MHGLSILCSYLYVVFIFYLVHALLIYSLVIGMHALLLGLNNECRHRESRSGLATVCVWNQFGKPHHLIIWACYPGSVTRHYIHIYIYIWVISYHHLPSIQQYLYTDWELHTACKGRIMVNSIYYELLNELVTISPMITVLMHN